MIVFFVPIYFSIKTLVNGQIREIANVKSFDNIMIPSFVIQDRQQLTNDIAVCLEVTKKIYQLDITSLLHFKVDIECKCSNALLSKPYNY